MSLFFYICAGVCGVAALQERRDFVRCVGFVLFGSLLAFCGYLLSQVLNS